MNIDLTGKKIPVLLSILDTAGQSEFSAMRDQCKSYKLLKNDSFTVLRTGNVFVIVYSIVSRSSLEEVEEIFKQIHRAREENIPPIVVVGNKADLEAGRMVIMHSILFINDADIF